MAELELTPEAIDDLGRLRRFDQQRVVSAMESQLTHDPERATRHRKRLRPNRLAEWELRTGDFRIFYDVMPGPKVKVVAIGYKVGNDLFVHGERFDL